MTHTSASIWLKQTPTPLSPAPRENTPSNLANTPIAAMCVQAICRASAPSTSSFGATPSMSASALLTAISEMPLGQTSRALKLEERSIDKIA